ncbi:hypothetical protein MGMO_14c00010 [Methyloglobulus morosus KoM1]|uniref:Polyketide cyclase/dehydrase n=1 Tax=Methyloglobulus morosus KoM1 TaxID=1116472 RepID=V5BK14_9GAMM|nr:hypothetical protein [Methyloglobulus morosus]ESS73645.1 hypothetical protein MGMO_14c00010 [Methyloglobulus morosus KoM1]
MDIGNLILTGERFMPHLDISPPIEGKARIEVNKPVAEVFRFVGEKFFENYPKWALEVSEFKPLNGLDIFVGARAIQTRLEQGQKEQSIFEVSEFEPLKKLTLAGVDAPFRTIYQFSGGDRQDVTVLEYSFEILDVELFMLPFEKLIRTAIEEGAENTVANIKILLEDKPH